MAQTTPAAGSLLVPGRRIRSLDQFRGFTVLAMFLVNFLHGKAAVPQLFQHNENWFSLADWILPGFLFAAGAAFRLTWQRRIAQQGTRSTVIGYGKRSAALIGISVIAFGFGTEFPAWTDWNLPAWRLFLAALVKARLWEVLAIIGATQLLLLPVIGKAPGTRAATAAVLLLLHALLSQAFNVHFVLAQPNALDAFWGAADVRAWDGGCFGLLNWAAIALAGSIACDWLTQLSPGHAVRRLLAAGLAAMLLGYGMSCLSTLYDVPETQHGSLPTVAHSPVFPRAVPGTLRLAEPPFTPVPPPDRRQVNYWMMSKRLVTVPFAGFAAGMVFVLFGIFVFTCDHKAFESSVLRILGGNALAAFLLHYAVMTSLLPLVPADAPWWFVALGLSVFLAITLSIMHALEKRRLFLRL